MVNLYIELDTWRLAMTMNDSVLRVSFSSLFLRRVKFNSPFMITVGKAFPWTKISIFLNPRNEECKSFNNFKPLMYI